MYNFDAFKAKIQLAELIKKQKTKKHPVLCYFGNKVDKTDALSWAALYWERSLGPVRITNHLHTFVTRNLISILLMRTAVRLHFSTTDSYTAHRQRAPDISLSGKQTTLQRQISDEAHYCGSASLNNAMNQWADCKLHQKKHLFHTTQMSSRSNAAVVHIGRKRWAMRPPNSATGFGCTGNIGEDRKKAVSHTWLWCPLWAQLFQSLTVCVYSDETSHCLSLHLNIKCSESNTLFAQC